MSAAVTQQKRTIDAWKTQGVFSAGNSRNKIHAIPAPPNAAWEIPSPINAQRRATTITLSRAQARERQQIAAKITGIPASRYKQ
jgi:hypothetical protein